MNSIWCQLMEAHSGASFRYLSSSYAVSRKSHVFYRQDHVVMGAVLTKKDTLFTRDEFQQILFAACSTFPSSRSARSARFQSLITSLPPCILKPVPMWSGKQVVQLLIHSFFLYPLFYVLPKTKLFPPDFQFVDGTAERSQAIKLRQPQQDWWFHVDLIP